MKSDEIIIHLSGRYKKIFEEVQKKLGLKEPEAVVASVFESFQKMHEEKSQGKEGKEDCSEVRPMWSSPFDVPGIEPWPAPEIKLKGKSRMLEVFKGLLGAYGKK